jgi:ATP-dependent helicase HrpA
VWDEAAFARLRDHVAGNVAGRMARIVADVVKVLQAAREVRRRLDELRGAAMADVRQDVASQIGRLVYPGFISATGAARLPDIERYLRGAAWRLERFTRSAAVDRDRMGSIHELEALYRRVLDDLPAAAADGELGEVPWMLEELRISSFAQAIGPKGQVTARRVRRILEDAASRNP